ncbi:hypothetical protein ACFLZ0_01765 [Patescibacteria group bacterium]
MKKQWLNLVLYLTNRIYNKKQIILKGVGIGVVSDILSLIILETSLGVISLPLYLGIRPVNVTAFLEEKGGYDKITSDYNLRRVLTLTGVGVIFVIWMIKLMLITLTPSVLGPLHLYSVSDLRPVDVLEKNIVAAETKIQTARVVDTMARPKLTEVKKRQGENYIFYGTGQPSTLAVMFLSGRQTVIFTSPVDENGNWEIDHSQDDFKLSEGNHSIVIFGYDEKSEVRSPASAEQYFKVQTSLLDSVVKNIDILINISIAIVIFLGVLLTVLII